MALTGVMPFCPLVLNASLAPMRPLLLRSRPQCCNPFALPCVVAGFAAGSWPWAAAGGEDCAGRARRRSPGHEPWSSMACS